mmetsp:Transcript_6434/g.21580  ORF Transcript_6434/g.21580 Transcript_6434/m.21580 type:complete len:219 (-) Transcript_6434:811-1467(-)
MRRGSKAGRNRARWKSRFFRSPRGTLAGNRAVWAGRKCSVGFTSSRTFGSETERTPSGMTRYRTDAKAEEVWDGARLSSTSVSACPGRPPMRTGGSRPREAGACSVSRGARDSARTAKLEIPTMRQPQAKSGSSDTEEWLVQKARTQVMTGTRGKTARSTRSSRKTARGSWSRRFCCSARTRRTRLGLRRREATSSEAIARFYARRSRAQILLAPPLT